MKDSVRGGGGGGGGRFILGGGGGGAAKFTWEIAGGGMLVGTTLFWSAAGCEGTPKI
jgi:hypothetical protein